ncbi:MAG: Asp-tRNA(Asn)/Glu-tRNA(Gln) amidotransferase subunit GatB, partial [Deinococcus sp.]|nr:Asp-tRNA(Asn)/Glu-tRNA(Gln) amidotransferase subunit GatB [Deinococcus sp.]
MNGFEAVIGLEVHLHLKTESKMFCGCRANYFGSEPNLSTCPVCLGLPGSLPVINRQAVEHGIMLALALDCEVSRRIQFYRKNYFYPDLPKNYQITGQNSPVGENGTLDVGGRQIHIHQVHLEEDVGKSVHPGARSVSLVDLNRAGVPLTELVTEPDITSPQEARDFLSKLRTIAQTLGISTANPEEGAMRADVNVSVRPKGQKELGVKVEIKNLNSFRSVQRALEYEIDRQIKVLGTGGRLGQETRSWDDDRGTTETMRSKEFAHDYRYFPDPDLVPLLVDEKWIEFVKKEMPELAPARAARFAR